MHKVAFFSMVLCFSANSAFAGQDESGEPPVRVHYLGHASFVLQFDNGISVLTDYGKSRAYDLDSPVYDLDLLPDVVTYSHEHEDHAGGKIPGNDPHILKGMDALSLKGIDIEPIPTHERSLDQPDNTSYLFTYKGIRILHLGDCQALIEHCERSEVKEIIDDLYPDRYSLVLVPIGFVSDIVKQAASFIRLIDARAFVPMHYWSPSEKAAFLEQVRDERGKGGDPHRVVAVGGAKLDLHASEKDVNEIQIINLEPGPFEGPR